MTAGQADALVKIEWRYPRGRLLAVQAPGSDRVTLYAAAKSAKTVLTLSVEDADALRAILGEATRP